MKTSDYSPKKIIIKYDPKKPFSIYGGLQGRIISTKTIEGQILYQVHFNKEDLQDREQFNDVWFREHQFTTVSKKVI